MQGEKVDPDDDQFNKDQSSDQTGRDSSDSVLSRSSQPKIVYLKTGLSSEPLNKL